MLPSSWFLCKSRTSREVILSRVLGISPSKAFPETSLNQKIRLFFCHVWI
jgi:hypothetical protein